MAAALTSCPRLDMNEVMSRDYDRTGLNYSDLRKPGPRIVPELVALDEAQMPRIGDYERWLGPVDIGPVSIPHDCTDGFLCAYLRRPAAYLDPEVRAAISSFWKVGDISEALSRLEHALERGAWAKRYSGLLNLDVCDCGYRLVVMS
jgi:hypothetical protein